MKIIENNIVRYESGNEIIRVNDFNSATYDKNIYDKLLELIPESFRNYNKYLNTLSTLSSYTISKEILLMEDINNIYNPDSGSRTVIDFLANRYDITFPVNYDIDKKRLILKYFPNFIKIKGTEFALKILDFIDRSEIDFYNSKPGNYEIEYYYEGYTKIKINDDSDKDRISKYLKFAQTLVNRVTPAGMYSEIIVD